ncbi:MAG: hypothetical protein AABY15_09745, partial [Nanoarchaeota archaeon]
FIEKSLEYKKAMVSSSNVNIKSTFIQLTQLAFDSDKMDFAEYKAIMGNSQCQKADCSDKLCVNYKLLCCVKHPNSPNC